MRKGGPVKETHPTHDEMVSWLDGTLLARRKKSIESHMSRGCASCAEKADAIRATLIARALLAKGKREKGEGKRESACGPSEARSAE